MEACFADDADQVKELLDDAIHPKYGGGVGQRIWRNVGLDASKDWRQAIGT
jgi:Fe-S cluster biosynthesis and repair protein YggX